MRAARSKTILSITIIAASAALSTTRTSCTSTPAAALTTIESGMTTGFFMIGTPPSRAAFRSARAGEAICVCVCVCVCVCAQCAAHGRIDTRLALHAAAIQNIRLRVWGGFSHLVYVSLANHVADATTCRSTCTGVQLPDNHKYCVLWLSRHCASRHGRNMRCSRRAPMD